MDNKTKLDQLYIIKKYFTSQKFKSFSKNYVWVLRLSTKLFNALAMFLKKKQCDIMLFILKKTRNIARQIAHAKIWQSLQKFTKLMLINS